MPRPPPRETERLLKALANGNRLKLLESLQTPKGYGELSLPPTRRDALGSRDRPISRQAVRRHLRDLMKIGVVLEAPEAADGRTRYVVNHAKLFGVVEEMRKLATVRATVDVGGATMALEHGPTMSQVTGPSLVLVRGVQEGRAFSLVTDGPEWTLGRDKAAAIRLDYDPYVSGSHARVMRKGDAYFLVDLDTNKNGTHLNWGRMVRGGVAPLKPGDVIGVGMSLLVFRA